MPIIKAEQRNMNKRVFIVDRDYYSKNREILDWIRYTNPPSFNVDVTNIFGYMHYTFDDVDDYALFVLTWGQYGQR